MLPSSALRPIVLGVVGLGLLAALIALLEADAAPARSGAPDPVTVAVGDYWYCGPAYQNGVCDTAVAAGETVVWDFAPSVDTHTVVECGSSCDTPSPKPAWDSGVIGDGSTFS